MMGRKMNEVPAHAGPYALAQWVAHQLPRFQGATQRELYHKYLPQFAAFGTDGSTGSTLIGTHLRKLEEQGLVISEKRGKERAAPRSWQWVGPPPDETCVTDDPVASDRSNVGTGAADTTETSAATDQEDRAGATDCEWVPDPLDGGDPWDTLARQFAQACREQAGTRPPVNDLAVKLRALRSLQTILSDDLAELLGQICNDLQFEG
jgi:hypothetical protein